MSNPINNYGLRGRTMAIACVTAIGASLVFMYGMGRDVKKNEGLASLYKEGQGVGKGSDVNMTSQDVAAVASSVPKPGKERIPTTQK